MRIVCISHYLVGILVRRCDWILCELHFTFESWTRALRPPYLQGGQEAMVNGVSIGGLVNLD